MRKTIYLAAALAALLVFPTIASAGSPTRAWATQRIKAEESGPHITGLKVGFCLHHYKMVICPVKVDRVEYDGQVEYNSSWWDCVGPQGYVTDSLRNGRCQRAFIEVAPNDFPAFRKK